MGKTLFDKIWDRHVVKSIDGGQDVLYIDRHLIHEVTSPQAFEGLRKRGVDLFRKKQIVATADHNVPTINQDQPIRDALSRHQVDTLVKNCEEFGIELFGLGHPYQGIVHVIGPELGITQPGMTMVCGDSHTSTHGAFGTIAFGIGTSQVEQVMATQCLLQVKPKTMRIVVDGQLKPGVTAKDVILYVIAQLGAEGGTGHFVEYAGEAIRSMTMEERMTVCNMSIEMGARGGMVAADETTFSYLAGRPYVPSGEDFEAIKKEWANMHSDDDAAFDTEHVFNAADIEPMVTFGTSPDKGVGVSGAVPKENPSLTKALAYMGLNGGDSVAGIKTDYVFIGSCTNSRIEDLRAAASVIKGRKKAEHVTAWVVPGSRQVMDAAIKEGLDATFREAGFEFREPGCSACLAMNDDKIPAGALCVSTSNRNFEGRQGPGARTVLASPLTAAAAAISGVIEDPRNFLK